MQWLLTTVPDHRARWGGPRDGTAECWRNAGPNRRALKRSYSGQQPGRGQREGQLQHASSLPCGAHGCTGSRMGWCGIPSRLAVRPTLRLSIELRAMPRGAGHANWLDEGHRGQDGGQGCRGSERGRRAPELTLRPTSLCLHPCGIN